MLNFTYIYIYIHIFAFYRDMQIYTYIYIYKYMFMPTARKPGQRFYVFLLSKSECYAMDCFGTYSNTCPNLNVTRVQSATQWTASVQTLHMPKLVM